MSNLPLDSFECPKKYKTIGYITDKMNEMDAKKRKKLSQFLNTFNIACLGLESIADLRFFNYSMGLVKEDYKNKIVELGTEYDSKLLSYVRNFVLTKLKLTKYVNSDGFITVLKTLKSEKFPYIVDTKTNAIYLDLIKYGYVVNHGEKPVLTHRGYALLKRRG